LNLQPQVENVSHIPLRYLIFCYSSWSLIFLYRIYSPHFIQSTWQPANSTSSGRGRHFILSLAPGYHPVSVANLSVGELNGKIYSTSGNRTQQTPPHPAERQVTIQSAWPICQWGELNGKIYGTSGNQILNLIELNQLPHH
jgi:hypothetical protein